MGRPYAFILYSANLRLLDCAKMTFFNLEPKSIELLQLFRFCLQSILRNRYIDLFLQKVGLHFVILFASLYCRLNSALYLLNHEYTNQMNQWARAEGKDKTISD